MTSQRKEMKAQCLNSDSGRDFFGSLPQDLTGNILNRIPTGEALTTSILSSNWRNRWKTMTSLVFNEKVFDHLPQLKEDLLKDLASAILNVLESDKEGSIHDIEIDVSKLDVDSKLDKIIDHLSKSKHLKKLRVVGSSEHYYKLPSSFFSLESIELIRLVNCHLEPPKEFDGFKKLHTVRFGNVDITSKMFQIFLSKCPLLRDLALVGGSREFAGRNKLTFVELLQCVPSIEILKIKGPYMQTFSAGDMPNKLPTSLVKLKCLYLGVCYKNDHQVSSALCLISSFPNLEELCLMGYDEPDTAQISKNFPDIKNYPGITLDHLHFFWMKNFVWEKREKKILKLIMAKSPGLKKALIELDKSISHDEHVKILADLVQYPIEKHESSSAELILTHPNCAS